MRWNLKVAVFTLLYIFESWWYVFGRYFHCCLNTFLFVVDFMLAFPSFFQKLVNQPITCLMIQYKCATRMYNACQENEIMWKQSIHWILLVLFYFRIKKLVCGALMLSSFKNLLLSIFMFFKIVWMRKVFGAVFSFLFFLRTLLAPFLIFGSKRVKKGKQVESVSFFEEMSTSSLSWCPILSFFFMCKCTTYTTTSGGAKLVKKSCVHSFLSLLNFANLVDIVEWVVAWHGNGMTKQTACFALLSVYTHHREKWTSLSAFSWFLMPEPAEKKNFKKTKPTLYTTEKAPTKPYLHVFYYTA